MRSRKANLRHTGGLKGMQLSEKKLSPEEWTRLKEQIRAESAYVRKKERTALLYIVAGFVLCTVLLWVVYRAG